MEISRKKVLCFALVVMGLLVVYEIIIYCLFSSWTERGAFGDTLNAFFSILVFGGIIHTIMLQREELQLQRQELKLTRQELKRTAEAQEKSEKALSKQVNSMERTAMLNGLNALLIYHTDERNRAINGNNALIQQSSEKHCQTYIHKINLLIEEIEKEKSNA